MENIRKVILEDGTEYTGYGFGSCIDKKLELVFQTSMTGYQEIITDPSYTDQAVVMTYPVIGNYGVNEEDCEAAHPSVGALIVREYTDVPSNFRAVQSLSRYMEQNKIPGVYGVDTRALTRHIRDRGSCKVLITGAEMSAEKGKAILDAWDYRTDQVSRVSTKRIVSIPQAAQVLPENTKSPLDKGFPERMTYHVVAIDCGIKQNILRTLNHLGCRVSLVPYDTDAAVIESLEPDGIFLSNGPGDPRDVASTIETVRALHGKYPIFGICLGHQILARSYGAETYKLKFGHRGGNHPVKELETGRIDITSQNHSYAVDPESIIGTGLIITHRNLLDDTVEGIRHETEPSFGIQYHPEAAPGPQDSRYLFERFLQMMQRRTN